MLPAASACSARAAVVGDFDRRPAAIRGRRPAAACGRRARRRRSAVPMRGQLARSPALPHCTPSNAPGGAAEAIKRLRRGRRFMMAAGCRNFATMPADHSRHCDHRGGINVFAAQVCQSSRISANAPPPRACSIATGARAPNHLARPHREDHRALSGRRLDRCAGAHPGRPAEGDLRPALRDRKPSRCRRQYRHRHRHQQRAGRLHHRRGHHRPFRDQPVSLQQDAVRSANAT